MIKKIVKLVFLLMIINNYIIIAQVSGYMGKRCAITFNTYSGPNYFSIFNDGFTSGNNSSANPSLLKLNYKFEASYVVTKHIALGVNVGVVDTRNFFLESGREDVDNNTNYSGNNNYYDIYNSCRLSGYSLGLTYKYYLSNCIAPLGNYFQIDLLRSNYKIIDFYSKRNLYKLTNNENIKLSSLGINLTYGKSRIYLDRIIVTTGLQIGLTEGVLMTQSYDSYISADYSDTAIKNLRYNARVWYGWSTIFNFHLGLGFLAF